MIDLTEDKGVFMGFRCSETGYGSFCVSWRGFEVPLCGDLVALTLKNNRPGPFSPVFFPGRDPPPRKAPRRDRYD